MRSKTPSSRPSIDLVFCITILRKKNNYFIKARSSELISTIAYRFAPVMSMSSKISTKLLYRLLAVGFIPIPNELVDPIAADTVYGQPVEAAGGARAIADAILQMRDRI